MMWRWWMNREAALGLGLALVILGSWLIGAWNYEVDSNTPPAKLRCSSAAPGATECYPDTKPTCWGLPDRDGCECAGDVCPAGYAIDCYVGVDRHGDKFMSVARSICGKTYPTPTPVKPVEMHCLERHVCDGQTEWSGLCRLWVASLGTVTK